MPYYVISKILQNACKVDAASAVAFKISDVSKFIGLSNTTVVPFGTAKFFAI